jgi:hypothetical protein
VKVQDEWRSSRGFVEDLDWRRQLEQLAEAQHRNQPDRVEAVVESRTKNVEDPK